MLALGLVAGMFDSVVVALGTLRRRGVFIISRSIFRCTLLSVVVFSLVTVQAAQP